MVNARNQHRGLNFVGSVAVFALDVFGFRRTSRAARQVGQPVLELGFQPFELIDLRSNLAQFGLEELPGSLHCGGPSLSRFEVIEKAPNLRQRQSERLETVDPAQPNERMLVVEAVSAFASKRRPEQSHSLVQSDGARTSPRTFREVSDPQRSSVRNIDKGIHYEYRPSAHRLCSAAHRARRNRPELVLTTLTLTLRSSFVAGTDSMVNLVVCVKFNSATDDLRSKERRGRPTGRH